MRQLSTTLVVDEESFEEKLKRWSLRELLIEQTKEYVYSPRKISRIRTRIAELQNSEAAKPKPATPADFVSVSRLEQLRNLASKEFDFSRLIKICEELNSSWESENFIAVSALTRILLDHVPPVFRQNTFSQVVANAGRSNKAVFEALEQNSRKIADGLIHQQMRRKETTPTAQAVNFSQNVDVLLAEIVRCVEEAGA